MSHIHFPPECANDPVIGPLMPPKFEAQIETYESAVLTQQKYAETGRFISDVIKTHVGHNLVVAGRKFMPFSIIEGPEIVMEPYSRWQDYEHLITIEDNGKVSGHTFIFIPGYQLSEEKLQDCLLLFRRYLVQAVHPLDKIALDAAIAECIHQIDKQRRRQRKRCEAVR